MNWDAAQLQQALALCDKEAVDARNDARRNGKIAMAHAEIVRLLQKFT